MAEFQQYLLYKPIKGLKKYENLGQMSHLKFLSVQHRLEFSYHSTLD